jgi:hypothetical protein
LFEVISCCHVGEVSWEEGQSGAELEVLWTNQSKAGKGNDMLEGFMGGAAPAAHGRRCHCCRWREYL